MMTKVNWEYEDLKNLLKEKGFDFKHDIGSITFTSHVFVHRVTGKRIEVYDDKSGGLEVVNANNKPVDLSKL